jgi:hypothetical protein
MAEYFYLIDGQQHGPVSSVQLQEWVVTGQLNKDLLVWKEGMEQWEPISTAGPQKTKTPETGTPRLAHRPSTTHRFPGVVGRPRRHHLQSPSLIPIPSTSH